MTQRTHQTNRVTDHTNGATTGSTGSSSARAHAREDNDYQACLARIALQDLAELYKLAIGSSMPELARQYAYRELMRGVPGAYFTYALQEAAFAPRPSWRYAMAIVARLCREKVEPAELILDTWADNADDRPFTLD